MLYSVVSFCTKNNHALIEGFPKTLKQGISLHSKGLIPEKVIFVNLSKNVLFDVCYKKIKSNNP